MSYILKSDCMAHRVSAYVYGEQQKNKMAALKLD